MSFKKLSDRDNQGILQNYYNANDANILPINFSPKDIPGLLIWVKSSAGVINQDGIVSQWSDQSGLENNLTQLVTASRPTLVANGHSNYPTIRTVAGQFFVFPRFTNIRTIYWVTKDNSAIGTGSFLLGDFGGPTSTYDFHADALKYFDPVNSSVNIRNGLFKRNETVINGTVTDRSRIMSTLSLRTTGGVIANSFSADRDLGRHWIADTLELIIYSSVHTDEQISKVENYLKQYKHY